jgi:hypothetical protein
MHVNLMATYQSGMFQNIYDMFYEATSFNQNISKSKLE